MKNAVVTSTRPRTSAYHPAVAPIGSQVQICIAVRWISPGLEGACDYVVDYCGSRFLVFHNDIKTSLDKEANLVQVCMAATILSHDGRVSYVVSVPGAQFTVHEQHITSVPVIIESEVVL